MSFIGIFVSIDFPYLTAVSEGVDGVGEGGSQYSEQGSKDWLIFSTPRPHIQDNSVHLRTVLLT